MSSFPPPPPPPGLPPTNQPPGSPAWSTPISALTDPAPPVSPKKSGVPAWIWIASIAALLGGGAFVLFTRGGDDNSGSASTINLGGETTLNSSGTNPEGSTPSSSGEIPTGITGTRDAPVPAGQIADIGGDWRLQVLDVIPDASAQMAAADEFFQPAPAGSTYMLVKLALGYFGTEDPKTGFEPDLAVFGTSSTALDDFCLVTVPGEVDLFNYIFSGGVVTGNACFIAPVAEAGTFQLFGKGDFLADDGIYLELASPSAPVQPMTALAGPQPGAASTPARLSAAPVGTPTAVGPDWQLTVTGAARDITADVLAENEFNTPPPAGFHYVGIEVSFLYNGAASASPASVSIASVGADNVQHAGYCGLVPAEVDMYTELFASGTASGTMCLVLPDDGGTFALFATADYTSYVWFATS